MPFGLAEMRPLEQVADASKGEFDELRRRASIPKGARTPPDEEYVQPRCGRVQFFQNYDQRQRDRETARSAGHDDGRGPDDWKRATKRPALSNRDDRILERQRREQMGSQYKPSPFARMRLPHELQTQEERVLGGDTPNSSANRQRVPDPLPIDSVADRPKKRRVPDPLPIDNIANALLSPPTSDNRQEAEGVQRAQIAHMAQQSSTRGTESQYLSSTYPSGRLKPDFYALSLVRPDLYAQMVTRPLSGILCDDGDDGDDDRDGARARKVARARKARRHDRR